MASLIDRIKNSSVFRPGVSKARSAESALFTDQLRKLFGKDYLDSFEPKQAYDDVKEEEIIVRVASENPFVANRDHEGLSRRFNTLNAVNRVTPLEDAYDGIASDPDLADRIRQGRKVNLLSTARKAKEAHDKSYPIVSDILDWMFDSIVQETGKFYTPDRNHAVTTFDDAKKYVASAVEALKDPRVFQTMAINGLADKTLQKKLKKHTALLDQNGNVDPAKVAPVIEFKYLNEDHQNPGKTIQFDEERSRFYRNSILKAVFGKKNLFTRKSVLNTVHEGLKAGVTDLQDEIYRVFAEPEDAEVREELWDIVTENTRPEFRMSRFYKFDLDHDGKISSHFNKDYRGVIANDPGDEQVQYVDSERSEIDTAKVRQFWQVINQYDARTKELEAFEKDFIEKPEKKNVYQRLTERLDRSIYTDRTPEAIHQDALRYLNSAGVGDQVVNMLEGHTKTKLAIMDVNDLLKDMYVEAKKAIVSKTDPALASALDQKNYTLPGKISNDEVDYFHKDLLMAYHAKFPNTDVNKKIKPFLALYQVQRELRTL